MHWVVLKKEIMLNVEDISLTRAKEKHLNIDCSGATNTCDRNLDKIKPPEHRLQEVLAGAARLELAIYFVRIATSPLFHLS